MTASFTRMANVTASTKRNPAAVGGKIGLPATYLTGLKILPLMPVSKEIIERYQLKSPRKSFVTYTEGAPDIAEGDKLVIASIEYGIVAATPWPTDQAFFELVVEKVIGA
jgi:hypothetical protein